MNSINQVKNAISAFAAMDPSLTHSVNLVLDKLNEGLENAGFEEEEIDDLDTLTESLVNLMEILTSEQVADEVTGDIFSVVEKEEKEFVEADEELDDA